MLLHKILLLKIEFMFFCMQIIYSLLFSLVIAFISDALSTAPDKVSVLSHDGSFRRSFNDTVRLSAFLSDVYLSAI